MNPDVQRTLVLRCRNGDTDAYQPLVRAYEARGFRLAVGLLGNEEDADDALQESFVKAYNALHAFDPDRPFGPWFFGILRNQCRDLLRSRAARFRVEVLDPSYTSLPAGPGASTDPERMRRRSAARELLWRAMERVGAEHREVLVLKELEGLRYGEIAAILEIPEGTVASRLFHARRALRDTLRRMGVTDV